MIVLTQGNMDVNAELERLLKRGWTSFVEIEPSATGFRRFQMIAGETDDVIAPSHVANPTRLALPEVVQSIEDELPPPTKGDGCTITYGKINPALSAISLQYLLDDTFVKPDPHAAEQESAALAAVAERNGTTISQVEYICTEPGRTAKPKRRRNPLLGAGVRSKPRDEFTIRVCGAPPEKHDHIFNLIQRVLITYPTVTIRKESAAKD